VPQNGTGVGTFPLKERDVRGCGMLIIRDPGSRRAVKRYEGKNNQVWHSDQSTAPGIGTVARARGGEFVFVPIEARLMGGGTFIGFFSVPVPSWPMAQMT
jgi:hypothetical protein